MNHFTTHFLEMLMSVFLVDTEAWGKGEAKTINDLFGEVLGGESYLRIDGTTLTRVVEVAKIKISQALYRNRGYLIEVSRSLPDGRISQRNGYPAEKLKRHETPAQAVVRGIHEELQLSENNIHHMAMMPAVKEIKSSKSYPNLQCIYILHESDVVLLNSVSICHKSMFETKEDDGTMHQWKWERFS